MVDETPRAHILRLTAVITDDALIAQQVNAKHGTRINAARVAEIRAEQPSPRRFYTGERIG